MDRRNASFVSPFRLCLKSLPSVGIAYEVLLSEIDGRTFFFGMLKRSKSYRAEWRKGITCHKVLRSTGHLKTTARSFRCTSFRELLKRYWASVRSDLSYPDLVSP